MKNRFNRRDFLKLLGAFPLSFSAPKLTNSLTPDSHQNVIIVVFDAFSARNISLYGYPRETTPNITRLSEKAIVYHNHYSGGNFTTPGTASLLTGTLPWTHRAIKNSGTVQESFSKKNIFSAFENYYRLTYSHNPWVYKLLHQFERDLEKLIPLEEYILLENNPPQKVFKNDEDTATVSWVRTIRREEGYSYSLFLTRLYELYEQYRKAKIENLQLQYPRGIPSMDYLNYFLLEDAIDNIGSILNKIQQPFLGYFHFWPPHTPYRTRKDFFGLFSKDGFQPVEKPFSPFSYTAYEKEPYLLPITRTEYDESILYADSEFARFYNFMEQSGILENTWLVLTSDHGELFERGISGHTTPVLYEPLIRIPLIIFEPGRSKRKDIFSPTSAIDVLPTLLKVTGQNPASWTEGSILPPFSNDVRNQERALYTLEARTNEPLKPLTRATATLLKGNYKLMYFFGYEEYGTSGENIELYDIENDPEELNNLHATKQELSQELLNQLKDKLTQADGPYR